MNRDDDVLTGLRASFVAHEGDADPAVARRIASVAGRSRRRPGLAIGGAVVAVVIVLVVATVGVLVRSGVHAPGQRVDEGGAAPSPTPSGQTSGAAGASPRRTAADAAAARVLAAVPVPRGAVPRAEAPTRRLRRTGCVCGVVDQTLTRTAWWTVPMPYADLVAWYEAHTPADTSGSYVDVAKRHVSPSGEMSWEGAPASDDYSAQVVVITYEALDATTTAIRTDVTVAARFERPPETTVPPEVTDVEITRSVLTGTRTTTRGTVTDPAAVSALVTAFNGLAPSYAGEEMNACGSPVGIVVAYDVTFRWPGHTLVSDAGHPLCGVGRGLVLDGTTLPPRLDGTAAFDRLLGQAMGS